jgi:tRNA threonylcarbamoyladenosine biosynthesis protein TsaB
MQPPSNPTVLALDAAGGACAAALWRDGAVVAQRRQVMDRGHAEYLMPMVEDVVHAHGYAAVDLICVGTGPGGYTGLRIALAAARGLGLATGRLMLGIANPVVHARMARHSGAEGRIGVVLETRRSEFFVQLFDPDGTATGGPVVLSASQAARLFAQNSAPLSIAGDAVTRFADLVADPHETWAFLPPQHADAGVLAELGAKNIAQASRTPPQPLYLRPPDTSSPAADKQRLHR